jgi:CTP:molybdopterin cytidylyltransferase MocA
MTKTMDYIRPAMRPRNAKTPRIFPVLLAAGSSVRLGFPKPLARFGGKTALEIAVANCAGLRPPVVVLGDQAGRILPGVPRGARVVIHRRWRAGQLSSLLAGLRQVPRGADFLVYPVDHPLLTRGLVKRLVAGFLRRGRRQKIVLPRRGRRVGHPVVFSAALRGELLRARTAREVVYRDRERIEYVRVRSAAIREDFDTPASYRRCLRQFRREDR